jgi:hypothetical protein
MKQLRSIWLLAAAAVLAAACTRVQVELPESEVSFQVTSLRPATKAVGDYTDIPFGAYAWFKGEDPADNTTFMTNQQVVFDATKNRWEPLGTTYYWPKSGSLDFICYSPYSAAGGPVVGENSIQFNGWDVSAQPTTDLLYADKASGQTRNLHTYNYNGVPVLFRHALSRLRFTVKLAYNEKTASTGDKTKWEVTVNSITDIALDCSALHTFVDTTPQEVGDSFLVLPQPLDLGQKLVLNLSISTWRDTGSGYPATPFITETAIEVAAGLNSVSLPAWGINQFIHYTLILTPSRGDGTDNPAEITFDPAVADWETISTQAEINL